MVSAQHLITLWRATVPCDCKLKDSFKVDISRLDLHFSKWIEFCPLHSAAEELLLMCKAIHEIESAHEPAPGWMLGLSSVIEKAERQA